MTPPLFYPNFRGCSLWTRVWIADVVAPRSEDPTLIIRVINFELVQRICSRFINVTDRQTDRRPTIAIPRFAQRASRGKNGGDYHTN